MSKQQWLIISAFAITYFVWGSTYLANKWAIDTLPPFGMCGVRFLIAGSLLYGLSFLAGDKTRPTRKQWVNSGYMGFMFLTLGVGIVVWAQQWMDSSITALLVAFQPLLVMFIMWGLFKSRPPGKAFLGAAISIVGMGLLIGQPQLVSGRNEIIALVAVLFSVSIWALAMTLNPRLDTGKNNFRSTAMQMLVGGALAMLLSLCLGEWVGWTAEGLSWKSIGSLSYLIIFGAIVAFSAFNFLMKNVAPEKAATGTYVNPVVAMVLGAFLNQEAVTLQSVVAGAVLITGVYFINSSRSQAIPANREEQGEAAGAV
ncbi:EamA family transporter [Neolewinella aurantiaca]|uniref:EamA family transporter n=1 Tax=Neolewinella aurantiaca TaxID=2602767 RepID=A0A5C7FJQ1_9BACT|nr:EamA family transporter [Neolewinella aurantiaca]TXF91525.1 EamA family transporter [Neolewinella aurantiaca]